MKIAVSSETLALTGNYTVSQPGSPLIFSTVCFQETSDDQRLLETIAYEFLDFKPHSGFQYPEGTGTFLFSTTRPHIQ